MKFFFSFFYNVYQQSPGYLPTSLPLSCLTMAPRLDALESHCNRKPLGEMNFNGCSEADIIAFRVPGSPSRKPAKPTDVEIQRMNHDIKMMLHTLKEQLAVVLKAKPARETTSASSSGMYSLPLSFIHFIFCIHNQIAT